MAIVQTLVIGGGAGGGTGLLEAATNGGGAGAGGNQYDAAHVVTAQSYSITVGNGGSGANFLSFEYNGHNGNNSIFDAIIAYGGGYGAGFSGSQPNNGGNGAYGGGGSSNGSTAGGIGSQGYNGGYSFDWLTPNNAFGGGGAGASANGQNGSVAQIGYNFGNGGDGIVNPISGSTIGENISGTYWICGGGAGYDGPTGGKGGGANSSDGLGHDGLTNSGGGGSGTVYGNNGGNGGSGAVVISYKTDGSDGVSPSSTGGTITTSGGYTIHTFITSDTFNCVLISNNSIFLGIHL
jgi:hypothetical protein